MALLQVLSPCLYFLFTFQASAQLSSSLSYSSLTPRLGEVRLLCVLMALLGSPGVALITLYCDHLLFACLPLPGRVWVLALSLSLGFH